MKIQELFKTVNIEHVLPIIHSWYYSNNEGFSQEGYRKAYASLCTIGGVEEVPEEYKILDDPDYDIGTFIIQAPDEEFDTPWCMSLEFRYWEITAHKEVVCAEGLSITPEEMAAVCLWHMTFCGFDAERVRQKVHGLIFRNTDFTKDKV